MVFREIKGVKNQISGVGVVVALVFFALVAVAVMMIAQITIGGVQGPVGDKVSINIANTVFDVKIVRTQAERERGLMEQIELCATCGMMFVFDKPGAYSFWMKDTPLSLDIVWTRHGRIVYIAQNTVPNSEKLIKPDSMADKVLEFPAGTIKRIGAKIGDVVQW